ncbi:MAG: hypothetical protein H0W83_16935 [Planctomycetes bacterium]|nr:hypothetical protein [Planctomycetota bacterium]
MVLLLALGLYLASGNHARRSLAALSLAALAKPFAVVALLPSLIARSWVWWLLPPVIAAAAYMPFLDAGGSLFASMGRYGSTMHFHGPLEPYIRLALGSILAKDVVQPATIAALAVIWIGSSVLILARFRRAVGAQSLEFVARLLAMLLICLPTLHAWYFAPLVLLLPFTRSWGLVLWTAMAPVYWLHAIGNSQPGDFSEIPWVTTLAHAPALALLAYEAFGRPNPWREHAGADEIVAETQPV